ncbi:MAG: anion permease [Deltaproteobacteria bacterium]|nr:anion permease [Deltaproteobacteria bacterium]MBW2071754.1 anion permease [Deltaproteobacteria bacterium]
MWKVLSGAFLGWSLGANDSANVFGTGVLTGLIKYRTAILLTAFFVLCGALIEGQKGMETVEELSLLLPLDAFYCALAAALTISFLTYLSLPASTSQAIIGAVTAAGLLSGTADFLMLYKIVLCWVLTPVGGIIFSFVIYKALSYGIDRTITSITGRNYFYALGIVVAGCYGAYSLGGNNVANVTAVYVGAGVLSTKQALWIGGASIAAGVLTYSKKVMVTIGKSIAPLDPFSALVTVLAEAFTLHLFTQVGVPVSSSQAIVGAVVGVGLVRDSRTLSTSMLIKIALGWLFTPLIACLLTILFLHFIG